MATPDAAVRGWLDDNRDDVLAAIAAGAQRAVEERDDLIQEGIAQGTREMMYSLVCKGSLNDLVEDGIAKGTYQELHGWETMVFKQMIEDGIAKGFQNTNGGAK